MQASFHITIYKERGTVSMKKYVVIIDLHCDPTIPSGSGDSGGGNAYSRSLLQELQKNNVYHIYITRKKYSYLEEYIQMTSFSEFYRLAWQHRLLYKVIILQHNYFLFAYYEFYLIYFL